MGTNELMINEKKSKSDLKWFSAVKALEKSYKDFMKLYGSKPDVIKKLNAKKLLGPLYSSINEILSKLGHNPSIETGAETTTRDLLANIKQLLGN